MSEQFKSLLLEQEENLTEVVLNHKQEVEELVSGKRTLKKKSLQKQFEFTDVVAKDLQKVKKNLSKNKVAKSLDVLEKLISFVEEKQEDLQIADSSPHGWLAVSCVRNKSNLPKELQKKVEKVNSRLDKSKELSTNVKREKYGYKKYQKFDQGFNQENRVRIQRGGRQSPQEMLQTLAKQKRAGMCSHCNDYGHFYRECSKFWAAVQESRRANGSSSGGQN